MYVQNNNSATYVDSFGVEHIPKEIKAFINNKNIKTNIFRVQKHDSINPKVSKTSNNRTMVLSKCATCGSKKSRFIKNQEVKGLLSNLDIKTPLTKVPILGDILF